jgi:hypothetical protein
MGFGVFTIIPMRGSIWRPLNLQKFHSDTGGHFIFLGELLHFSKDSPFCLCTTSRFVTVRLGMEINF